MIGTLIVLALLVQAWLLGPIPLAKAEGAEADRGLAMRCLAELPWSPDALE